VDFANIIQTLALYALPVLFAMARLHHSRYLAAPMPGRAMQNGGHRGA